MTDRRKDTLLFNLLVMLETEMGGYSPSIRQTIQQETDMTDDEYKEIAYGD